MARSFSTTQWQAARRKFVEGGGHTTQSFGLGRIIGQVYALLYLSPAPLCLDDIAKELSVSKASVSTTVRQLQSWAAVKPVWVQGDRKDYYSAETDFRAVLKQGILETLRKKLTTAGNQLEHVEQTLKESRAQGNGEASEEMQVVVERLEQAKKFHGKVQSFLSNPFVDHLL